MVHLEIGDTGYYMDDKDVYDKRAVSAEYCVIITELNMEIFVKIMLQQMIKRVCAANILLLVQIATECGTLPKLAGGAHTHGNNVGTDAT